MWRRQESHWTHDPCYGLCCYPGWWDLQCSRWRAHSSRVCCMDASRERSIEHVSIIASHINTLYNNLCINSPEQRRLGWDEWFEKVSPEGKDWLTNVVSIHPLFMTQSDYCVTNVGAVSRKSDKVHEQHIQKYSMYTALVCRVCSSFISGKTRFLVSKHSHGSSGPPRAGYCYTFHWYCAWKGVPDVCHYKCTVSVLNTLFYPGN